MENNNNYKIIYVASMGMFLLLLKAVNKFTKFSIQTPWILSVFIKSRLIIPWFFKVAVKKKPL